ncbi:hypothetical protein B0H17DRAFT_1136975 [Mycena rosella]|uniref:Uncharacterized protein n=1 Tax=Mycena rosella TaxID=1033263 RepID=A0AAD7GB98_MYCRO|nr:hypothetical protein B0H17DRAFT_1136975 [Mycena rosella]
MRIRQRRLAIRVVRQIVPRLPRHPRRMRERPHAPGARPRVHLRGLRLRVRAVVVVHARALRRRELDVRGRPDARGARVRVRARRVPRVRVLVAGVGVVGGGVGVAVRVALVCVAVRLLRGAERARVRMRRAAEVERARRGVVLVRERAQGRGHEGGVGHHAVVAARAAAADATRDDAHEEDRAREGGDGEHARHGGFVVQEPAGGQPCGGVSGRRRRTHGVARRGAALALGVLEAEDAGEISVVVVSVAMVGSTPAVVGRPVAEVAEVGGVVVGAVAAVVGTVVTVVAVEGPAEVVSGALVTSGDDVVVVVSEGTDAVVVGAVVAAVVGWLVGVDTTVVVGLLPISPRNHAERRNRAHAVEADIVTTAGATLRCETRASNVELRWRDEIGEIGNLERRSREGFVDEAEALEVVKPADEWPDEKPRLVWRTVMKRRVAAKWWQKRRVVAEMPARKS